MTSIIGVLCKDGVVVGTDSAATFSAAASFDTIEQQIEKITVVENILVAGTGSVGLHQRFSAIVGEAYQGSLHILISNGGGQRQPVGNLFARASPLEVAKILSRAAIEDMRQTYLQPGGYGALVAFSCGNEPHLCEFQVSDFQPELKDRNLWYVSMGSAQAITDPFLGFIRSVFWEQGQPSVSEAILAVTWTLQHAIDLNPGGVNGPIRVAVLERSKEGQYGARRLEKLELDEYQQHIRVAHDALRKALQDALHVEGVRLEVPRL